MVDDTYRWFIPLEKKGSVQMVKRIILAIAAVFVALAVMDFAIHGLLLGSTYEATAELWRPMEEMNMLFMYFVTLVFATGFVLLYALLIGEKSLKCFSPWLRSYMNLSQRKLTFSLRMGKL